MFRSRIATTARRTSTRVLSLGVYNSTRTMAHIPKPNTTPPKGVTVLKNIAEIAADSDKFRRVIWTGRNSQLVIMTIPVGGEIGEETHTVDQHLNFISGNAQAISEGKKKYDVGPGDSVIVPAGTLHNFKNTGSTPLIVSTVYAPAEHKADTVHDTLEEGERLEEEGKDKPPEWAQNLHKPDDGKN